MVNERLDALDEGLIEALEANVRRPTLEMANELGVSAPTVKRRIERLLNEKVIGLGPVVDLHAAGYEYLMVIGVNVEGCSPTQVAGELANLTETLTVNVVLGHFDIEVVAAVESREEVGALLSHTLPAIKGVANLSPALALDVWKFQSGCVAVEPGSVTRKKLLEALDLNIIDCLRDDARMSNRAVAAKLGISESAVRVRIRRMQEQGQMKLAATRTLSAASSHDAFVGVSVQGGKISSVCKALVKIPEVSFVCTTLGRNDIMCCVNVTEMDRLAEVLHEQIARIPNVKSTDPSHCLKQVKHQSMLGLIL